MPYKVRKVGKGYKVVTKATGVTHSKKSMSKAKAKRQAAAIYANTKEGKSKRRR